MKSLRLHISPLRCLDKCIRHAHASVLRFIKPSDFMPLRCIYASRLLMLVVLRFIKPSAVMSIPYASVCPMGWRFSNRHMLPDSPEAIRPHHQPTRPNIDKSIDPDSRDMTAFAALYSPRHRWRGMESRLSSLRLIIMNLSLIPIYQRHTPECFPTPGVCLFLLKGDFPTSLGIYLWNGGILTAS